MTTSDAMPSARIVTGSGAVGPRTSGATSGSMVGASVTAMASPPWKREGSALVARTPPSAFDLVLRGRLELVRDRVGREVLVEDLLVRPVRDHLRQDGVDRLPKLRVRG